MRRTRVGGGMMDSSSEVGQALEGCLRESKGVCGSLKGPRKVRARPPEPLRTLRLRPDSGRELRRPPK